MRFDARVHVKQCMAKGAPYASAGGQPSSGNDNGPHGGHGFLRSAKCFTHTARGFPTMPRRGNRGTERRSNLLKSKSKQKAELEFEPSPVWSQVGALCALPDGVPG